MKAEEIIKLMRNGNLLLTQKEIEQTCIKNNSGIYGPIYFVCNAL